MAVKWTTILIGALDRKSNVAVTRDARAHPANLFPSVKAEIAVKTRQVFSSHTACVGCFALRN